MDKEFQYMANLAKLGDTITILLKDADGVRETLTFDFKESEQKHFTEEQIRDLMTNIQYWSDKDQEEFEKWEGTSTNYGDTDLAAADVYFGRREASWEIIERIKNFINKQSVRT